MVDLTEQQGSQTKDPFDPSNLRLNQDFSQNLGVNKVLVVLPVRKPPSQEFIRVHPDEQMRIITNVLEYQADRELYLVSREVAEILGKEVKPRRLVLATTATGNLFLWPMKITPVGERENTWNMSADAAMEKALTKWVNIGSNLAAQAYDVRIAEGTIPEPEWPQTTLKEILKLAFGEKFIQSVDHPVVQKLKGIF